MFGLGVDRETRFGILKVVAYRSSLVELVRPALFRRVYIPSFDILSPSLGKLGFEVGGGFVIPKGLGYHVFSEDWGKGILRLGDR